MKVSAFIVQHLAENKTVSLQGIGSFYLDVPAIQEDGIITFPESSIRFEQNARTREDESLIQMAVTETKKLKSLVTSDIDSFIQLGQQFLHLGKPFDIAGLGSLRRNFRGEIEFLQNSQPASITEKIPSSIQEKKANEISFAALPKKKNRFKPFHLLLGIMILLAILTVYYFLSGSNKTNEVRINNTDSIGNKPSSKMNAAPNSTGTSAASSNLNTDNLHPPVGFRIVIKEYNSLSKARFFYDKLKSDHDLIIYTKDSLLFKVAVVFDQPLKDSTVVNDSMHRILGLRTYVELP